ncbi:uncharacterized protein LOC107003703 [Solanum pennellii]|uniref:Uncharacterized protein LOC107003703 n=1 Tax=Solanum pennellii TaxID=28526 RepID=A0ABM1FIW9_SOLPN|nr:uncharacterized protein LOC107003703 [Solanum pennellii]
MEVSHVSARPKAYFTLWIMLNRKLATVDRLAKWGMLHNKACVLCKSADESIEHIFIECHYARKVWERLLYWIDNHSRCPMTWSQFIQWSIQHGKGKTTSAQLFKSTLAEGVYELWNERNKRLFEDKSSLEDKVVKEIAYVTIARASNSIKSVINQRKL